MLASFKHLKNRNWIIAANYPVDLAYEPIKKANLLLFGILAPIALLAILLQLRALSRLTSPILALAGHVETLADKKGDERLFPAEGSDEPAILAQAFNRLVREGDRQQEEHAKREVLYRTVVDFSSEMVFWIAPDSGTMHYVSPKLTDVTGYTPEEFYASPGLLSAMIHPDDREHWDSHGKDAGTADFTEPSEFRIVTKTGEVRWTNYLCRPVFDRNGGYAGMRGSFSDISLLKRADELLRRQNEYLTAFHETSLGLVRRLDVPSLMRAILVRAGNLVGTEHCYVYLINEQETEMNMVFQSGVFDGFVHHPLGPRDGIAGRVWTTGEPFHVDDYSRWEHRLPDNDRAVLRAMAGVPLKSNNRVIGVLGLAFIEEGQLFDEERMAILTQFGELASVALDNAQLHDAVQRELSERRKAEERLRKLSVAVEQSPASIIIMDTGGTIEYVNPRFSELTGYSAAEAVGRNTRMFKSDNTAPAEYRRLWKRSSAGANGAGSSITARRTAIFTGSSP